MKRQKLIRELRQVARDSGVQFELAREGGNHTVYRVGAVTVTVPRHTEISDRLAQKIIKQARGE